MQPNQNSLAQIEELNRMLATWLDERQQLLIQLNHLCSLRPFDQPNLAKNDLEHELKLFCQHLVDYISRGQFEVLEKLFERIESSPQNDPLSNKRLIANLTKTTMCALDFNDKYAGGAQPCRHLEQDLSFLGERIAHRLELEDKLIALAVKERP